MVTVLQLLEAMNQDSGIPLRSIQVDGGMTANNLLMQIQADLMGIDVGQYHIASTKSIWQFAYIKYIKKYIILVINEIVHSLCINLLFALKIDSIKQRSIYNVLTVQIVNKSL